MHRHQMSSENKFNPPEKAYNAPEINFLPQSFKGSKAAPGIQPLIGTAPWSHYF